MYILKISMIVRAVKSKVIAQDGTDFECDTTTNFVVRGNEYSCKSCTVSARLYYRASQLQSRNTMLSR
jgi:hypothetical protein